jgi:hypothetical protein
MTELLEPFEDFRNLAETEVIAALENPVEPTK